MCGRYLLDVPGATLAHMLGAIDRTEGFEPTWNAAPSQQLPVLGYNAETHERSLVTMQWGLVPAWAAAKSRESGKPPLAPINARVETIIEKPMFKRAFLRHRCAVPVSGFYEWHRPDEGPKVPHLIREVGRPVSLLAGIYESWRDEQSGERHASFAMLTCEANGMMRDIHHRMPVFLRGDGVEAWLTASADDAPGLLSLAVPCPDEDLEEWVVSTRVNSVANNDPTVAAPIAA